MNSRGGSGLGDADAVRVDGGLRMLEKRKMDGDEVILLQSNFRNRNHSAGEC
jgi:hypothetical protein